MKKRFSDLKKTAIFAAGHLKRSAILATLTVFAIFFSDLRKKKLKDYSS